MKAFCSLEIGFTIFLIEIDGDCEVLDCLTEITEDGEDESSEIEIFGYVILAFLDGFINISDSFIEVISVEMKYSSEVVEGGDVIVAELW